MKGFIKRILNITISLILLIISMNFSMIVSADQVDVKIITAKEIGEGIDKFNYFPSEKWTAGKVANEYFTNVDTRLPQHNDVYYSINFEGTAIEVWGFKAPRHAIVEFTIDGKNPIIVDTYNATRAFVKLCEFTGLDFGEHQVIGKATGNANIKAAFGDIQVTEARVYKPKNEALKVSFEKKAAELYVGNTYQIEYAVEPVNSKLPADFEFLSSDEEIAVVDPKTGIVTALKKGKVSIAGTCQSLGIYESMEIEIKEKSDLHITVVDSNNQYQQKAYDQLLSQNIKYESLWSWKNDKAISEFAIATGEKDLTNVSIEIGEFKNEQGMKLDDGAITATFIKEVKGFIGNAGWYSINPNGVMPTGPKEDYFDVLYTTDKIDIQKNKIQLVWVDFETNHNTKPGMYTGFIDVKSDDTTETQRITYTFEVLDTTFGNVEDYTFKPDYWTYPFSSAEYYDVEPFSQKHLAILKDHLLQYKEYGGVTLTGTLVEEAWGGQTYGETDKEKGDSVRCPSLIKWIKKTDGTWKYDYAYFDKYIALADSIGLANDIVLYSPIPWNDQITYFDEASNTIKKDSVNISNKAKYASYWKPFLQDFANHLDEKGMFENVSLGFDERPLMKNVFEVIDDVKNKDGKTFRKQGAYNNIYNGDGVPDDMENMSFNLNLLRNDISAFKRFVQDRKEKGLKTTFYTGTDIFPNTFLRSLPAEGYWTMMFSGSLGLDGFLDWAYDAWVEDPLNDATHSSFQAGDCFMVYPAEKDSISKKSKVSIRSEKYDEGVRDINKLYQMKKEYPELKDDIDSLFSTVKSNYDFTVVENEPGWAFAGGKPARWITEKGKNEILTDVNVFKKGIYEISKKYEQLKLEDVNKYTITYTDGVKEEVFKDQVITELLPGTPTPAFDGIPEREGYVFKGWTPEVASEVTKTIVYTAAWSEDKNKNGIEDLSETKYTITYTDGVKEEVFKDQVIMELLPGTPTPAFDGIPKREGYIFKSWTPAIENIVTRTIVYEAAWVKDSNKNGVDDSKEGVENQSDSDHKTNHPDTGDQTYPGHYACMVVLSGFAIVLFSVRKRKRNVNTKE